MGVKSKPDKYKNCCDKFGQSIRGSYAIDPVYDEYGEVEEYYIYDRDGFLHQTIEFCPFCSRALPRKDKEE